MPGSTSSARSTSRPGCSATSTTGSGTTVAYRCAIPFGDCELDACTNKKCVVPTATDAIRNGSETDVDCGGAGVSAGAINYKAPRCTVGKGCGLGADCLTGACSPG